MSVHVSFPDELLVATRATRAEFSRRVQIYALGQMYQHGMISSGIAATVLGCDRWEFYRLLSEHGFDVITYDYEELDHEAQTSRELALHLSH